ncbi:response regulator transcription factor [Actinomadura opuntiae]|uniref:response regulator transcription factor n=1 Tax=Actinomadura sp. OS1-43 TaxID=604315 RepID=UPI00255B2FAE|nr:response regulator transcription factor [Actinomadura sp. OS1-43]MDL4814338.1 response regulator transcription factor [Actinomadura sp. OS1-43]
MGDEVRVLVVDDEPAVREAVGDTLSLDGYDVCVAADGASALREIAAAAPDTIVLDVLMPGMDGLHVCRSLREGGDRTPILMLTARDAVRDRVDGLDAGADDYLVKPFAPEELRARVRALLRRVRTAPSAESLGYADLTLFPEARQGRRGGRLVQFSETEFALLELLVVNAGQVLPREVIMDRVWGYDFGPESNSLGVYVGYVRRKLEAAGEPRLVHTVRGIGYVLRAG